MTVFTEIINASLNISIKTLIQNAPKQITIKKIINLIFLANIIESVKNILCHKKYFKKKFSDIKYTPKVLLLM